MLKATASSDSRFVESHKICSVLASIKAIEMMRRVMARRGYKLCQPLVGDRKMRCVFMCRKLADIFDH